ncbi:hypothetical protein B0H34DRAFT_267513 [Crassisporium funariophilum]|nr:hypothetical protein B0H34DRAFT_267513 [Crassisporium funariophilum]
MYSSINSNSQTPRPKSLLQLETAVKIPTHTHWYTKYATSYTSRHRHQQLDSPTHGVTNNTFHRRQRDRFNKQAFAHWGSTLNHRCGLTRRIPDILSQFLVICHRVLGSCR